MSRFFFSTMTKKRKKANQSSIKIKSLLDETYFICSTYERMFRLDTVWFVGRLNMINEYKYLKRRQKWRKTKKKTTIIKRKVTCDTHHDLSTESISMKRQTIEQIFLYQKKKIREKEKHKKEKQWRDVIFWLFDEFIDITARAKLTSID